MTLSAPKQVTWWISLILVIVGAIGVFTMPITYAAALMLLGYVLLALGTLLKGL
jgi:hypothetical protein